MVSGPAYKFNDPVAMAVAGSDMFVANLGNSETGAGSSVTELHASTGALVRVLSGPAYNFDGPGAMAVADGDLFVANYAGGSVTELNLDGGVGEGALGPAYKFDEPDALAVAGDDLFVANGAGNSVTEVPM